MDMLFRLNKKDVEIQSQAFLIFNGLLSYFYLLMTHSKFAESCSVLEEVTSAH